MCPDTASDSPVRLVRKASERLLRGFDLLAEPNGVEMITTIGDACMARCCPFPGREDHSEAVADLALAMEKLVGTFNSPDGRPLLHYGTGLNRHLTRLHILNNPEQGVTKP
jgi:hypothetical protein